MNPNLAEVGKPTRWLPGQSGNPPDQSEQKAEQGSRKIGVPEQVKVWEQVTRPPIFLIPPQFLTEGPPWLV
jgi:hypothetical protein